MFSRKWKFCEIVKHCAFKIPYVSECRFSFILNRLQVLALIFNLVKFEKECFWNKEINWQLRAHVMLGLT